MGVVEDPVTNGISMIGITNRAMPGVDRELGRDQGRRSLGPVFDNFHEQLSFGRFQRGQEPVIDGEQIVLGESSQEPGVRAIEAREG